MWTPNVPIYSLKQISNIIWRDSSNPVRAMRQTQASVTSHGQVFRLINSFPSSELQHQEMFLSLKRALPPSTHTASVFSCMRLLFQVEFVWIQFVFCIRLLPAILISTIYRTRTNTTPESGHWTLITIISADCRCKWATQTERAERASFTDLEISARVPRKSGDRKNSNWEQFEEGSEPISKEAHTHTHDTSEKFEF